MPTKLGWPAPEPMFRLYLGATRENEPAAATLSLKPATCCAMASPDVAAMSAVICASSIDGGERTSLLQATDPTVMNTAAAARIWFLNFIKALLLMLVAPDFGAVLPINTTHQEKRNA